MQINMYTSSIQCMCNNSSGLFAVPSLWKLYLRLGYDFGRSKLDTSNNTHVNKYHMCLSVFTYTEILQTTSDVEYN